MTKYFIYYFFIPFSISLFAGTRCSIYVNQDYESEWLTEESAVEFDVFLILMIGLMMGGFSLSILLNKFKIVRENLILNFLTWFIFPVFVFVWVTINSQINWVDKSSSNFEELSFWNEQFIFLLIIFLPYLLGAIVSFLLFKKNHRKLTT